LTVVTGLFYIILVLAVVAADIISGFLTDGAALEAESPVPAVAALFISTIFEVEG
jgi:hypothetical protein